MPKDFQYDVIQLIKNVKERSCLWDKSLGSYKDRVERKLAWEEVFNLLEPQYEEKSSKEKKITEEIIMTKWTYVRDAFIKTLKNRNGKPKRKYIYHKELKFLLKVLCDPELSQNSDEADSSTECTDNSSTFNTPIKFESEEQESTSVRYSTRKRSKKRDSLDKDSDLNFVAVEESDPRIMNEDEAFFASLLPSVVKYTEDERLEFRIEVLALMRRIKNKRNYIENE